MSFDFIPVTLDDVKDEETLPALYEIARDLNSLEILTKGGKFYYVSKNEAIKIWILKTLNKETSRFNYRGYSNNYGNEIMKLFKRGLFGSLLKSELKRYIEEALLVNPYIKNISDFNFTKAGSIVTAQFTVTTVYGNLEQSITYERES